MRRKLISGWVRRAALVAAHAADLVLRDGLRGWRRGARTAAPALGTLYAVLLLAGAGTLAAGAASHTLGGELQRATLVRVYLRQDVAIADVDALRQRLLRDPRVASVAYVDADAALAEASQRPGLARLAEAAGDNPFPARLEVRTTTLANVEPIVRSVSGDPAVDPTTPTSYDPAAYDDLRHFLTIGGAIAWAVVAALGLVAAAVTANAVRASVLARAEELALMRLLGAGGLLLRGPVVVEAALTGALAGLLAGTTVLGLFAGVEQLGMRLSTDLLPGVDWRAAAETASALLALGALIGALSAGLGLRRGGRP
jgi:cell division transport system permease protein